MIDNQWKTVYSANGILEAETIRIFLGSFDIFSIISQESAGSTFGFTIGPLGQAHILVKRNDFERAESILDQYEKGLFSDNSEESNSENLNESEELDQ
jgi:hypothetical protein